MNFQAFLYLSLYAKYTLVFDRLQLKYYLDGHL